MKVGDDINSRDKPEKLTQYGAFKVLPIQKYALPEVKPITGNNELFLLSVKLNGAVKVNINLLVMELNDINQVDPTTEYQL